MKDHGGPAQLCGSNAKEPKGYSYFKYSKSSGRGGTNPFIEYATDYNVDCGNRQSFLALLVVSWNHESPYIF